MAALVVIGALKLAFNALDDGWGDRPGGLSAWEIKSLYIHICLIQCFRKVTGAIILHGDISVWVIISLCIRCYLIQYFRNITVTVDLWSFILIIVLMNILFYLCVLNAVISYHSLWFVFTHSYIESRRPARFWCWCHLFYNIPTMNKIFLLLLWVAAVITAHPWAPTASFGLYMAFAGRWHSDHSALRTTFYNRECQTNHFYGSEAPIRNSLIKI